MYLDILRYILILRDCRLRIYLLTMPACMCNKFFYWQVLFLSCQ
jgi:hypothetical protein